MTIFFSYKVFSIKNLFGREQFTKLSKVEYNIHFNLLNGRSHPLMNLRSLINYLVQIILNN